MKSLYEGTSLDKATLLMIDEANIVAKRKRERDISRKKDRNIKRWIVDAPANATKYDKGKGGSMWANYNGRVTKSAVPLVKNKKGA